jgi:regulator of protease activity HflC (stomatin/prohibitin superfamily)
MKMVDDYSESVDPAAPASPIDLIKEKPDYLRQMKALAREMMAKATILIGIVIAVGILALLFAAIGGLPWYTIDQGERGVMTSFGKTSPDPLQPGLGLKWPVVQTVHIYPVRVQVHSAPASSASKDLQSVDTTIAINYHFDPEDVVKVYSKLSRDYERVIIDPNVQDAVKNATAQFTAPELIQQRPNVEALISSRLKQELGEYYIIVDGVRIVNFAFSTQFKDSIEAANTAKQQLLQAQTEKQIAQERADMIVINAEAKAQEFELQGRALKENPDVATIKFIEKWNGVLPVYSAGGSGLIPFLNVAAT